MKTRRAASVRAAGVMLGLMALMAPMAMGADARAGVIVGGSALLDADAQAQLERWLGAGAFDLDNVYTRATGDTAADFHAAADGRGATFTLLQVSNEAGASYLVGGYDPQSWAADEGWHETGPDWQRSAFLFNMTTPAVYRQVPSTYVLPSQGLRQTFNDAGFGPVFGSGPDLFVDDALTASISWQLGYGNPANEGLSIVDGSAGGRPLRVEALEIFAIAPVPEAPRAALLLAGLGVLGLLGGLRRRGID